MASLVIAVTGGVASGKSIATASFERLGIAIADADLAARDVVAPGQPALAEIKARFGAAILLPDGRLDRAHLRTRVFADDEARRDLEAITHPRIRVWLQTECVRASGPYAIAAIPLLAEGGGRSNYPWLWRVLVVDAPLELQRARLVARDGIDAALAERMLAAQVSREQRLALADDVIVNDGTLAELEHNVRLMDQFFRRLASGAA